MYLYICMNQLMEEKEEDAETVKIGGIYVICPLCLEKKKRGSEVRLQLCCGKYVCLACCKAHKDACRVRSVDCTCPYCRAPPLLDEDGAKLLLIKQGKCIVLVLM